MERLSLLCSIGCFLVVGLIFLLPSCSHFEKEEEDFSTIYFEPFPKTQVDVDYPFSIDNTIYQVGKKFTFEYIYKDSNNIEKRLYVNDIDFAWETKIPSESKFMELNKLDLFLGRRGDQDSSYQQSSIIYRYLSKNNQQIFLEGTGLVENEKNIWIHPPRQALFKILQLSPFPFIQKPYEIGNQYNWKFTVGAHYGDPRWRTWKDPIKIKNIYTIVDRVTLETPFGKIATLKIKGESISRLGHSYLMAYFNEEFGFVKLAYTNIDNSKIELMLVRVEE